MRRPILSFLTAIAVASVPIASPLADSPEMAPAQGKARSNQFW